MNIFEYSNISFQILIFIFIFNSWTFLESEYYLNIQIFWPEYSEIIWWKNTWIFKKQRQNLNTIPLASSKFIVNIDESQYVQNSFKFKYGFRVCKNLGFKKIYNFVQIYSNIFEYSNILRFSNNIRIFSCWPNNIRYSICSIFIRKIIFNIRFVQFSSDK